MKRLRCLHPKTSFTYGVLSPMPGVSLTQIPYQEHRELHLTIFRRLGNPFVLGLLEAYWDGYEAVELNTYADYAYLKTVWEYHDEIVRAIESGDFVRGRELLITHMQLLSHRGISMETTSEVLGL